MMSFTTAKRFFYKCLVILSLLIVLYPVFATQHFEFAGLAWGSNVTVVKNVMAEKGFVFDKTLDGNGDMQFSGEFLGYKTAVLTLFGEAKLAKLGVMIDTPDHKARPVYEEMKQILIKKYGPPKKSIEYFKRPYYEGDGFEEQAIRVGKGTFVTYWEGLKAPGTDYKENVLLQISEHLTVNVTYESSAWGAEEKRRKTKSNSIF